MQANPDIDALEIVELEDYESLLSFHNLEGEAPAMWAPTLFYSLFCVLDLF